MNGAEMVRSNNKQCVMQCKDLEGTKQRGMKFATQFSPLLNFYTDLTDYFIQVLIEGWHMVLA